MALPIASVSLLAIALSEFSAICKCTFRAPSFDFIGMAGSGRLQILASPREAAFSRL